MPDDRHADERISTNDVPGWRAARAAGGLFALPLTIGAAFGSLYSVPNASLWPGLIQVLSGGDVHRYVRAPPTGIVRTIEMTGFVDCALSMLTDCLAETLIASLLSG